jgi:rhodanese-related sulfurtransferase
LCNLAQKAAKKFASLGYPVKEMAGGFTEWEKKKYPIEK